LAVEMLGLRHRRPRRFWNEDLARFIGTHRNCGGGLDVSRLGNSVQIDCKGCGERIVRGEPRPEVEERLAPPPRRAGPVRPTPGLAALLAAFLAGAVVVAILLSGSGSSGSQPKLAPAEAESSPLGSAAPPAAAAAAPETSPAAGSPSPSGLPFRTRVPRGWTDAVRDTAVYFAPAGASPPVKVSVYFERNPSLPPAQMASAAAGLLRQRHPGASPRRPRRARMGGRPAMSVAAPHRGGREVALVAAAGGYRYLVIETIARKADRGDRADARRLIEGLKLGGR
jgi:hypothetical protein